ncbi:MAG TPA: hypothetical protein VHP11_07890, partial [Tepidisphaeraceae bacterium]|nr:hypothetical protein [Tepidisphaeraceae bacterium]
KYEAYFLTVYDLVKFARARGILCQGRGSAANSAVCYCIGITSVDPARIDLLFERFISSARNEPPDIDVDFEHERREEVLQYIYEKYGRERAGMTAEVISYRGRSAVRDVGKALGLSLDLVDQMAKKLDWWQRGSLSETQLRELGLDPKDPTIRRVVDLVAQLLGFPRHLSQHVGGMVMTRGPLCELVPIENASMDHRTVIEWDKDDIDALGILKVDVLALGMLTCISKALNFINNRHLGAQLRGTKARRHEGREKGREEDNGRDSNISGFDCVAEGNGAGSTCLSSNQFNAGSGAIWVDQSDEAGRGVNSVEHRGGVWAADDGRLCEVPADDTRLDGGIGNADRDCPIATDAPCLSIADGSIGRRGPSSARLDSQPGSETAEANQNAKSTKSLIPHSSSPPLCLCASVPTCLQLHTVPESSKTVMRSSPCVPLTMTFRSPLRSLRNSRPSITGCCGQRITSPSLN